MAGQGTKGYRGINVIPPLLLHPLQALMIIVLQLLVSPYRFYVALV